MHISPRSNIKQKTMMKRGKIFKTIAGICISLSAFTACESQMIDLDPTQPTTKSGSKADGGAKIFVDYEQAPHFRGGNIALLEFLDQNVRYPEGYEGCAQGRVVVSFTIEKDGSIVDPKVIKSVCKELDEEALRVVGLMPKWAPAKYYGETKRQKVSLPIDFKIK